jgi:photosystem II oxygen-evolving enhancer protein 1
VPSKITTKETNTLTGIDGPINVANGKMTWNEKDGIDFAPTTTQVKGGERFPFLFSQKSLVAEGNGDTFKEGYEFGGKFDVPSYRTEDFLDPKGRGKGRGYDYAVGLGASVNGEKDDRNAYSGNIKTYDTLQGEINYKVEKVDNEAGEIGGTFVSVQPSDADMGSKVPTDIKIEGKWFAKIEGGTDQATLRYTKIDKGVGKAIEKSTSYGKVGNSQL